MGKIFKNLFQLERDQKNFKRPPAIAAIPIDEKIEGLEGEVSGELLDENTNAPVPKTDESDEEPEPPPPSFPAESVSLP